MTHANIHQMIISNVRVDIIKAAGDYVKSNFNIQKLGKKKAAKLIKDSVKLFDGSAVKNFALYLKSLNIEQNIPQQPRITLNDCPEVFASYPIQQDEEFNKMCWQGALKLNTVNTIDTFISFAISHFVPDRSDE